MDISALRVLLRPIVGNFKDSCTNTQIPEFCSELGLPVPEDVGSKRDRWHAAFDSLDNQEILAFAHRLVELRKLSPLDRNNVQDLVWASKPALSIPKRYRRDISRALQRVELFHHWDNFAAMLRDIFVVYEGVSWASLSGHHTLVLGEIHRHFVRNPEDANVEWLFEYLDAFDLSNWRFNNLIEGLASADVQVDAESQIAIVEVMNGPLKLCGLELRQMDEMDGYPVYKLVELHAVHTRPKNLIFASPIKPDIRIRDAVSNDIEIVSNADQCLIYDRPIGVEGLRW